MLAFIYHLFLHIFLHIFSFSSLNLFFNSLFISFIFTFYTRTWYLYCINCFCLYIDEIHDLSGVSFLNILFNYFHLDVVIIFLIFSFTFSHFLYTFFFNLSNLLHIQFYAYIWGIYHISNYYIHMEQIHDLEDDYEYMDEIIIIVEKWMKKMWKNFFSRSYICE